MVAVLAVQEKKIAECFRWERRVGQEETQLTKAARRVSIHVQKSLKQALEDAQTLRMYIDRTVRLDEIPLNIVLLA